MKENIFKNRLDKKAMPDIIAQALKEAVFNGELKGGEQLKQEEIAGFFNVSLTPVREALRRLEAQGLVKISPNKGAFVTKLSADEGREIFEIRILLEKGAIEFAIENLTQEDIQKAGNILERMETEKKGRELSRLNWEFHDTLYRACKRPMLLEMIYNLHINVERYMRLYLLDMKYHPTSQKEHYELLRACSEKNAKKAARVLEKHMKNASDTLVEFLRESQ
ncbi:DNA-binding transcriptional regulator, GntR family [Peptoclostridium litorale DSM 5388]|uniref:Transcriptional regulator, GntR family n=1 Tax=Peptoclostridium litorale DSM 5388 TaxID=1121324 RepID=A0A069RMU9_PEPLI|nr:GntR family transcriptional regulator [Peptoclostridium litorale]KDR95507.1 transcriptional regulator, GntR family [Peptoclostridium litorale DSM 5388]SIO17230.1 DNA-binding transcriptional regulator, GntR family [Peptoclostridium litorale DSM 5388]